MTTEQKKRGFAAMDPQRVRELAQAGGLAAKNRHKWTSETGRAAYLKREANKAKQEPQP